MKPVVAIWFEYPSLNGGEHSMLAVLGKLQRVRPLALAPQEGPLVDELDRAGIEHLEFDTHIETGKRSREELLGSLRELEKSFDWSVLHANSLSLSRLTGAFSGSLSSPTTGHIRDIMKLSGRAIRDLNQNLSLVAVSQATAEFHRAQGLETGLVQVIYNGVDAERFQPAKKTGDLHRELGLPPQSRLIGTIGQVCLRKGQDLLPAIAREISRTVPDAHFVMVGERYSAKQETIELERTIVEEFARFGLADRLHPVGYRHDIPEVLVELDLLLHPARQEPLGRVLLEASAAGCPIIASDVGGTREIVSDGESALLFPVDDASAASRHLARLLDDDGLRTKLTRNARADFEHRFSLDKAAVRLEQFWLDAITSQGTEASPRTR